MALHMDKNGNVKIVTPPKTLTKEEKEILENSKINKKLINQVKSINFNIVYG